MNTIISLELQRVTGELQPIIHYPPLKSALFVFLLSCPTPLYLSSLSLPLYLPTLLLPLYLPSLPLPLYLSPPRT